MVANGGIKNSAKRAWNNCSELFRDIVLTIFAMILGSGKFLKDIGSKMFFMTALFAPILGGSRLGKVVNDFIGIIFVLGISYTNYLTSYSSLKYLIVKNFKTLKIDDTNEKDEESLLLSPEKQPNIQRPSSEGNEVFDSIVPDQAEQIEQETSIFQNIKNIFYTCSLHIISLTRMFFVVCDTYLGISNLYAQTAGLFGKTINPNFLNKLTNISGTYFAFSDGIMYCAYSYRVLIDNASRFRKSFSWENIQKATKWKLCLAGLFSSLGILTKGINDCFKISVSLGYVPFIKHLPAQALVYLSYFGGVNSIFAKSISEGLELGYLLYNPKPFWEGTKKLIRQSKVTYLKLFAFLLNSLAEAASGYQALGWLFDKFGIMEKSEDDGHENYGRIFCAIIVAASVASVQFAFSVRSLRENEKHKKELESGSNAATQVSEETDLPDDFEETPGLYHSFNSGDAMSIDPQSQIPSEPEPSIGIALQL